MKSKCKRKNEQLKILMRFGYAERFSEEQLIKRVHGSVVEGRKDRSRSTTRWMDGIKKYVRYEVSGAERYKGAVEGLSER